MRGEALDWLESSLVDLQEAKEAHSRGSYHLSAFLAHQAVEKALKAYIIAFKRVRPPKTRDPVELAAAASIRLEPSEVEGLSELSPYYVVSKVPKRGVAETVEGDSTRNLPKAPLNSREDRRENRGALQASTARLGETLQTRSTRAQSYPQRSFTGEAESRQAMLLPLTPPS